MGNSVVSKYSLQDRMAEAMAMTAVLHSLMQAENQENTKEIDSSNENQEKELSEITTKNDKTSPISVEARGGSITQNQ